MTVFDLLTLALFAGLVVLFLQRSVGEEEPRDHLWQYLVAALGCAVSNYVGNQGYKFCAVLLITGTLVFVQTQLHPLSAFKRS